MSRGLPRALSGTGRRLDRHLGPDLDHAAGRNLEEVGRVARAFGETDEHASCQTGMPEFAAGLSERRDRKNDVDMMSKVQPSLRAIASALRDVRLFHVAEIAASPR